MTQEAKRRRARKQNIQAAVLATVKVAGLLSIAVVAPNTLQLLHYTSRSRSQYLSRANTALTNLKSKGLIAFETKNGKRRVRLTDRGEREFFRMTKQHALGSSQKKWDGRWRLVTFDIPEYRRADRDKLRAYLVVSGFKMLQASLWVYPYECEELVVLLKTDFQLGKEVLYMVAETVEGDAILRKRFKLSDQ